MGRNGDMTGAEEVLATLEESIEQLKSALTTLG